MKFKIFGLLIFIIFIVGGWFFFLREDQTRTLLSPALQPMNPLSDLKIGVSGAYLKTIKPASPISSTLVPTPLLKVMIDYKSNLEEEVDRLTPEDFSEDFKLLQEQVNSL